jgi:hypothetical protein
MIFDAPNPGRLRPGHSPTNPICPSSTFSQSHRRVTRATQRRESFAASPGGRQAGICADGLLSFGLVCYFLTKVREWPDSEFHILLRPPAEDLQAGMC